MSDTFIYLTSPEVDEFKIALIVVSQWVKRNSRVQLEEGQLQASHAFLNTLAVKIENGGIKELVQWTEGERTELSFILAEFARSK